MYDSNDVFAKKIKDTIINENISSSDKDIAKTKVKQEVRKVKSSEKKNSWGNPNKNVTVESYDNPKIDNLKNAALVRYETRDGLAKSNEDFSETSGILVSIL